MDNTQTPDVPVEIKADLRRFNKAEEQVTKAVAALTAVSKIETREQLDEAMLTLKGASQVEKLIEAKRVELVKPMNDAVKKINEYAKGLAGKLPPSIQFCKNVVLAYNKEQQTILENKRRDVRGPQLVALGMHMQVNGDNYSYEDVVVYNQSIVGLEDNQWLGLFATVSAQIQEKKNAALAKLETNKDLNDAFGTEADIKETAEKIEELSAPLPVAPLTVNSAGSVEKVKGVTKCWTHSIVDESLIPREYLVVDPAKIRKAVAEGVREIPGVTIFQKEGLTIR